MSHVIDADAYRASVLAGMTPACQWVKLAVKRATDDRAKQSQDGFPFRFDEAKAERVCKFISLLTHIQGPLRSKNPASTMAVFRAHRSHGLGLEGNRLTTLPPCIS